MHWLIGTFLAAAAFAAMGSSGAAHHSIAMFDQQHPIELVGTVQEYRFSSPHTFIFLEVKNGSAAPVVWRLEGNSANSLTWDGWSSRTLRAGDEVRLTIEPLRSGAAGGAWSTKKASFKDGSPIVAGH
ncbi:MAG TPA: DUF6152 family protein [Xanthobacteraceae bacterium]|jgi:hypothetical protein